MGNTTSTDGLQQATEEVAQEVQQQQQANEAGPPGVKLYRFVKAGAGGRWELASSFARPRFYDADEDGGRTHDFWLEVEAGDVDARADDALAYVADAAGRRVTFAAAGDLWALKFPSPEGYRAFMSELEDDVFYNTYGYARDSAKADRELGDFRATFYADAAGAGAAPAAPMEVDTGPEQPAPGELREKEAAPSPSRAQQRGGGTPIDGMVIGANVNSYLQRGAVFDVMRNVEGGIEDAGISFSFTPLGGAGAAAAAAGGSRRTPGGVGTPGGAGRAASATPAAAFTPSRVLLANGETRMHMLSPGIDATRLFHADVEAGKVVSEWAFRKDGADVPMADISNDSKAAQLASVNTLLGLDANRLCRWDLRDRRGVVQEAGAEGDDHADGDLLATWAGGKDFARGTNFSCMATSGDGHVVVGSRDGRIRLYSSSTLTQAKTSIPGLGKPITAVDVTYDGRWVLATTDDYLMVVKASFSDGGGGGDGGAERSAFTDRGGGKLALPRLLRLKPEDRLATGGKPLRHGRFTWITEAGAAERWVVASCGRHTVIWNFRRVKSAVGGATSIGGLPTVMDYVLSAPKDEDVVDSNFVHDRYAPAAGGHKGDALVVATEHRVFTLAGDD